MKSALIPLALLAALASCGRIQDVGRAPSFTPDDTSRESLAMSSRGLPPTLERQRLVDEASLWSGSSGSLLGDRRAVARGDILTVVIEIDERAEMSNSSSRSRAAGEDMNIPQLFGIPQRQNMPDGASAENPFSVNSSSSSKGDGATRRREKLTLRVAATVTDVMPNGIMRIQGSQEVRVNFEMRELLVSGYVRPADISRGNQITYDKIASARISYGGRGQITDVQQPRWGQQISDILLPF